MNIIEVARALREGKYVSSEDWLVGSFIYLKNGVVYDECGSEAKICMESISDIESDEYFVLEFPIGLYTLDGGLYRYDGDMWEQWEWNGLCWKSVDYLTEATALHHCKQSELNNMSPCVELNGKGFHFNRL